MKSRFQSPSTHRAGHSCQCTELSQSCVWSWRCISISRKVGESSLYSPAFTSPLPGGQHAEDSQITDLAVRHQWKLQCPFQHKQAALIRLENGAALWSVLLQWAALTAKACPSYCRWAFPTPRAVCFNVLKETFNSCVGIGARSAGKCLGLISEMKATCEPHGPQAQHCNLGVLSLL